MTPGSVFFDPTFTFFDGDQSPKLFVLLTVASGGNLLTVRTTSKFKGKGVLDGCQINDKQPNYYFPHGSSLFNLDTWVLLDDIYEFSPFEITKKLKMESIKLKFIVSENKLIDLLECAVKSEDISIEHINQLKHTIETISSSKP